MIESVNWFELNEKKWYQHPVFKKYACSKNGDVIYKKKKILKPIFIKNELQIIFSLIKLKFYPLKRLVYEAVNDIDEAPFLMHLDGNAKNNCINNLDLLYIKNMD